MQDPRAEPEPLRMPKTVKADKAPGRHQGVVHELRGHRLLAAPMTVPDPRARKARREKGNAENRTNHSVPASDDRLRERVRSGAELGAEGCAPDLAAGPAQPAEVRPSPVLGKDSRRTGRLLHRAGLQR